MFPRLNTVFASRWKALWFAGMTCLLAYCSVPGDQNATSEDTNASAADAHSAIDSSNLSDEDRARAEDTLKSIESFSQ